MKTKAKKLTRYRTQGEVTKTKNRKNLLGQSVYKEKGTDSEGKSYKFKMVTDKEGKQVRSSYSTRGSGNSPSTKKSVSDYDQKSGDNTSSPVIPGRANIMVTPEMEKNLMPKKKGGSISKMKPMMKKTSKKK